MEKRGQSETDWLEVEVDGRVIGVLEKIKRNEPELQRVKKLLGVVIRKASPESLIRFNATTKIPPNMVRQFDEAFRTSLYKGIERRREGWRLTET